MSTRCPACGSEYTHFNRRLEQWECEDCGRSFEEGQASTAPLTRSSIEERTTNPVKVFLSYPHTSRWICVMIRDVLRRRGHDVWFDEERIHEGDDWRACIAEGIDTHRSVVSCLTRDAVREGDGARGVCLDELSIAISTPGCVVQSVLLEPADVVRPTAAVSHRQWLDMSNWQTMRERGDEEFRAWFEERMARLLEVVESDATRAFAGEVEEVYDLLPLANWNIGRENLLSKPFVGRVWLADEVEAWMDDPDGGTLCTLWGEPGVGKSAFSVHYALRSPKVAAAICLMHGNERYNSAGALTQSVAYQLACRFQDYRQELLRALRGTPVGPMGPTELADLLIVRPLTYRHVDGGHESACILVDGLDECGDVEANAAARLVRDLRDKLPRWLRLLVVSRPETDLVTSLRPNRELWLLGEDRKNMEDVEAFLCKALEDLVPNDARRGEVARDLARRSDGVFLFAEAAAESARLGGFDLYDESSWPHTLDEALHGWFERIFPDQGEYATRHRPQLGALLASPVPLPEEELVRLLDKSEADVGDLLLRAGTLLERGEDDFGGATLAVSHRYVADWLGSRRSGRFAIHPADALRAMATACHELVMRDAVSLTGFEASNAVRLCERAGLRDEARELRRNWELALRLVDLGDWLAEWGRYDRAGELYGQVLEMLEALAEELGTPEARHDLSLSLDRVGDMALRRGDLAGASEAFGRSLEMFEALAEELGTPEARRDLSVSLNKVGDMALRRGDLAGASEAFGRSLGVAEALAEELGTPEARRDLSVSHWNLSRLTSQCGDVSAAIQHLTRAQEIFRELDDLLHTPQSASELQIVTNALDDLINH